MKIFFESDSILRFHKSMPRMVRIRCKLRESEASARAIRNSTVARELPLGCFEMPNKCPVRGSGFTFSPRRLPGRHLIAYLGFVETAFFECSVVQLSQRGRHRHGLLCHRPTCEVAWWCCGTVRSRIVFRHQLSPTSIEVRPTG